MVAVCIAGMHRSGTSMVARMLNLCGLYLGEEQDLFPADANNPNGHWEHRQIVAINEEVLHQIGADWDFPFKIEAGWELCPEMLPIRAKATELVRHLSMRERWGWKDPRNSVTLPFWRELVPCLKLVICIRNPLEVTRSLSQRNGFSSALGFNLWLDTYERLLRSIDTSNPIVTHYDAYFHDPDTELRRVLQLLDIGSAREQRGKAIEAISLSSRHHRATLRELSESNPPAGVVSRYADLCARAGIG